MTHHISTSEIESLTRIARDLAEIVESLTAKLPPIPEQVLKRIAKFKRDGTCLYCEQNLDGNAALRGCHRECYAALNIEVRRGDRSDYQTVLEGLWSTTNKRGRKKKRIPPRSTLDEDMTIASNVIMRSKERGRTRKPTASDGK